MSILVCRLIVHLSLKLDQTRKSELVIKKITPISQLCWLGPVTAVAGLVTLTWLGRQDVFINEKNEAMKYSVRIMIVMGLALLLDACGPSSWITSSWKAQEAVPREYKKIVVVGLIRENDRSLREKMEQHLVGDLKDLGYEAICSCEEYSPKAFENMGEEKVIEKLRDSGADAVLTVVLLDKSRERYYVPGRIYYSPYAVYHNRFYGYYHTMYSRVYSPGYYVDDTKYFWESNLYDLKTQQLIYSAQSRSFDPSSTESLGHEYGQMIVNDLVKNKVLQDHQGPSLKAM